MLLLEFQCFALVWLLQSLTFLSLVIFLFFISLTILRQPEESHMLVHTVHTYTWYSLPVNTHFKTVPSLHLQVPLISQNYPSFIVVINLSLIFFVCAVRKMYTGVIQLSTKGTTPKKFVFFCRNFDKLDGLHAYSLWVYVCDQ